MPFVATANLSNVLKVHKNLSERLARFYIALLVIGVEKLHDSGILLRNLSITSLIIDQDGYIQLFDFGRTKQGTHSSSLNGSLPYFSPEKVARQEYTKQADWWSVGIIAYELVFGFTPFFHTKKGKHEHNIINNEVTFPNKARIGHTEYFRDFIRKLLVKNPEDRLGSKEDILRHPWFTGIP